MTTVGEDRSRAGLRWQWSELDELSPRDVYEMLCLRSRVFVVEQDCVFQDEDGADPKATHLLGWHDKELIGYARVFAPGVFHEDTYISRIVSAPEVRRTGIGRMIVAESLRFSAERWPQQPIRIAAQNRLRNFYEEFGFVAVGEPYMHDGILHLDMLRARS